MTWGPGSSLFPGRVKCSPDSWPEEGALNPHWGLWREEGRKEPGRALETLLCCAQYLGAGVL